MTNSYFQKNGIQNASTLRKCIFITSFGSKHNYISKIFSGEKKVGMEINI